MAFTKHVQKCHCKIELETELAPTIIVTLCYMFSLSKLSRPRLKSFQPTVEPVSLSFDRPTLQSSIMRTCASRCCSRDLAPKWPSFKVSADGFWGDNEPGKTLHEPTRSPISDKPTARMAAPPAVVFIVAMMEMVSPYLHPNASEKTAKPPHWKPQHGE